MSKFLTFTKSISSIKALSMTRSGICGFVIGSNNSICSCHCSELGNLGKIQAEELSADGSSDGRGGRQDF